MNDKQTAEDGFRESLKDLIPVAERLSVYCKSIEELIAVAQLALTNDAQLKLLMDVVTRKK